MVKSDEHRWRRSLAGVIVDQYRLLKFVGAGRIGYVYKAERLDFPGATQAVKLTFGELKDGWDNELRKVMRLALVEGVVHFHAVGACTVTYEEKSRIAQYTVWDFIPPGENLGAFLKRRKKITVSFLYAVVERVLHVLHACAVEGINRHGDLHPGNILIGEESHSKLDDSLNPRAPIYVSDFGYGTTDAVVKPKDDYEGLARITNVMLEYIDRSKASGTDRQFLAEMQKVLDKCLRESALPERQEPYEVLRALGEIKSHAQTGQQPAQAHSAPDLAEQEADRFSSIGYFQVSEMIGERWEWWKRLFVPSVPARSKILSLDIPTVVTGPRGCGKTMLFRRLSERLVVECGEVEDLPVARHFIAFYINANDFADAFSHFPEDPSEDDQRRLVCYANLCVLADVLSVQAARVGREMGDVSTSLLDFVEKLLPGDDSSVVVAGEDRLEKYRSSIEELKWRFPEKLSGVDLFPGFGELCQHRWLPHFLSNIAHMCGWVGERAMLLFIDDFSMPRVSRSMQRILNRLFFQRSPNFLVKLATEASSTFISEDSSGKILEDGDDYQLIDMGEESLFLPKDERQSFLDAVFRKRLRIDSRIPDTASALNDLLGVSGLSKTEFARRLREHRAGDEVANSTQDPSSQRRGRSRARVLYGGEDVFCDLWSGDTRTMIQLITDVVDQTSGVSHYQPSAAAIKVPIDLGLQDRVFRNRGGEWLSAHTRNEPTNPQGVKVGIEMLRKTHHEYALTGRYGDHLKAVVEAFVSAARVLLFGETYVIQEGASRREVPRMAFRLEVIDEFRLDGLAREIYRDLVRYGLFIRDSRGKSVRGTFVPRLFLRRLLLPYGALALSKRDSVQLPCEMFKVLLLFPDRFKSEYASARRGRGGDGQIVMEFADGLGASERDSEYDDLRE